MYIEFLVHLSMAMTGDLASATPPAPEPLEMNKVSQPPSLLPEDSPSDLLSPPPPEPPLLANSISELESLTSAVAEFQQCYDDLLSHLRSIQSSITSNLPSQVARFPNSSSRRQNPNSNMSSSENPSRKDHSLKNPETMTLDEAMCARNIRRYIITHLNDIQKLREEVPRSLKRAHNPPRLVLDSLGKFYLQGKKAYDRDSPMIASRDASIFMLECFLLMMGLDEHEVSLDMEKSVRDDAEAVAVKWRKRLVAEGGLAKASEVDARGLLLFVACFGVPSLFRRSDLRDLAVAGNGKGSVELLRRSKRFVDKMIETVEELMKNKREVDAVDMIYTFGLGEKVNPRTILLTYLRESKASWKSPKQAAPLEGKRKKLAVLKSISKCLERHNIDPAKLLPGWQVSEQIEKLEKNITELDRKNAERAAEKRKRSLNGPIPSKKLKPPNPKWPASAGHLPPPPQQPTPAINYSASASVVYGGHGAGLVQAPMMSNHATIYSNANYYGSTHGGLSTVDMSEKHGVDHGNNGYLWQGDNSASIETYPGPSSSTGLIGLYQQALSSDPYQFANGASVAGSESQVSNVGSTSTVPPHHAYFYQV